MLSSFPPAVAIACPMWDRFRVTGEASVVVASTRNQRERHLFMQVWRDSGGGRGRTGSLEIGRRKGMRKNMHFHNQIIKHVRGIKPVIITNQLSLQLNVHLEPFTGTHLHAKFDKSFVSCVQQDHALVVRISPSFSCGSLQPSCVASWLSCLGKVTAPSDGTFPSACRTINHDDRIWLRLRIQARAGGRAPGGSGSAGSREGTAGTRGAAPGLGAVLSRCSSQHPREEGGEPKAPMGPRAPAAARKPIKEYLLSIFRVWSDLGLLALTGTMRGHLLRPFWSQAVENLRYFKAFSE